MSAAVLLGGIAGLGSLHAGLIVADAALLGLGVLLCRRPPWWSVAIALPIAVTGLWSFEWWTPLWAGARILLLGSLFSGLQAHPRQIAWGYLAAMSVGAVLIALSLASYRPDGLASNPSVTGQQGLVAFLAIPVLPMPARSIAVGVAVFTLGVPLARAAGLAAVVGAVFVRSWMLRIALACVGLVAVLVMLQNHTGGQRLFSVVRDLETRRGLIGLEGARFTWLGYGYDSYVQATEYQRPHIIPVIAAYELGVLVIPIVMVIGWAFWTKRVPWQLGAMMVPLWLLTEEQWATPGGHYMLAMTLVVGTAAIRGRSGAAVGESAYRRVRRPSTGLVEANEIRPAPPVPRPPDMGPIAPAAHPGA